MMVNFEEMLADSPTKHCDPITDAEYEEHEEEIDDLFYEYFFENVLPVYIEHAEENLKWSKPKRLTASWAFILY